MGLLGLSEGNNHELHFCQEAAELTKNGLYSGCARRGLSNSPVLGSWVPSGLSTRRELGSSLAHR